MKKKTASQLVMDIVQAACDYVDCEFVNDDADEIIHTLEATVDAWRKHLRRVRAWKEDLETEIENSPLSH